MSLLDKPKTLRDIPSDHFEAIPELLRRLGPLTEYELKAGLKRKFRHYALMKLVEDEVVVVVEEEPKPIYGLPEHQKLLFDKGHLI